MKSGLTIVEMAQQIERQSKLKQDYLLDTRRLQVEPFGSQLYLHTFDDHDDPLVEPLEINQIAHRQIGTHLKIPAAYYDRIGRVNEADENFQLFSQETLAADDHAFAMKIKDTVMAAVDETRFTRVVGMMREATTVQMNTTDIPGVVRLASKDFNITEEESTGVLQRLIEGKDLTLYGLSNAVTRFSQDVDSYDRATALEGIGYNILSMPRQQWNRINQMVA